MLIIYIKLFKFESRYHSRQAFVLQAQTESTIVIRVEAYPVDCRTT
jgi:hypothetical protein